MRLCASIALLLLAFSAPALMSAEIASHEEMFQPKALAIAPDGALVARSASSPYVYRIRNCATIAEVFVDTSTEGRWNLLHWPHCGLGHQYLVDLPDRGSAPHHSGRAPYRSVRLSSQDRHGTIALDSARR
jgi:hypothetical protein